MKISTKGIYALEVIVDLAAFADTGELQSIKSVAGRRNLSEKYLERIVGLLKRNGVVQSTRGAYGGYSLARAPKDITVKEVLCAVEGNLVPVDCLEDEAECKMDCSRCATRNVWFRMWRAIESVAESVTIEMLRNESDTLAKEGETR